MTIDRLLIICSLVELSVLACNRGPGCFTCFQWAAVVLLCAKGSIAVLKYHRKLR